MPFHFCSDELLALLAAIPFIGFLFHKLHVWWHKKIGHPDHDSKSDNSSFTNEVIVTQEDNRRYSLTFRGLVAGTVLNNEPISIDDLVKQFPSEDPDIIYQTIFELIDEEILQLKNDKLMVKDL